MGNSIDCEKKETITYDSIVDNCIHIMGSKIESSARILHSKIWTLQHEFYKNALPRNWKYRQISSGISSSSYLAKTYANLILSYAYDLYKQNLFTNKDKLLVFDFGAGHGRLTYLIIKYILKQKECWFGEDEFPFLFVMTDCSQAILNWWKHNEYLKPYIHKGYIDMCCYDAETSKEFILQIAGKRLQPEDIKFPPFVILNSVLSCLRQDVIRVSPSGILPGKVTVTSSQHEYELNDPSVISRLQFEWTFKSTLQSESVIGWDKEIMQIINSYKKDYSYATLVIPVLGLQVMNALLALFDHRCVFCIGDEGAFFRDEVQEVKDPVMQLNGDIRMPINFDFIRRHVDLHQGWTASSPYHDDFRVLLCAYGIPKQQVLQLRLAHQRFLVSQSHDMIQSITVDMTKNTSLSLHLLMQLLRLSAYDPDFLLQAKSSLHSVNSSNVLSRVNIHDLILDLDQGCQRLFPVTIAHDACFDIARLYMLVQEYQTAADLFSSSIKDFGEHHASWFNRGICLYRLNQFTQAQFCFYRTLELNYEYEEARKYLHRITNNCHYTYTEFETPLEKEEVFIQYNEQPEDMTSEEDVDEIMPQSFVIDDVNFSALDEEGEIRREEEYIMIEQASEDEIQVENIVIPDKDDE